MREFKVAVCVECKEKRKIQAKGFCGKCYQRQAKANDPDLYKKQWQNGRKDPRRELFKAARRRAKQKHIPFSITKEDITIPEYCPILGIPLKCAKKCPTENSPSLDEMVVGKGYVKGNIQIISRKANTMKSNATPDELIKFAKWILNATSTLSNYGNY